MFSLVIQANKYSVQSWLKVNSSSLRAQIDLHLQYLIVTHNSSDYARLVISMYHSLMHTHVSNIYVCISITKTINGVCFKERKQAGICQSFAC